MTTNGLIDGKALKTLLIQRKLETLDKERRSTGVTSLSMGAEIRVIDLMLIYLNTTMEEKDTMALKLGLDDPIPTAELKAKESKGKELADELKKLAEKVPFGHSTRITGIEHLDPDSVYSRMWAMRDSGVLPPHIVPALKTDRETKKVSVYITHKTPEELAKMRKRKKKVGAE